MNKTGSDRRQAVLSIARVLTTAGILIACYYLLPFDSTLTTGPVLVLVGCLAGLTLLLAWQIRRITLSPWPGLRAMEALALSIPLVVLLFAAVYRLVDLNAPGSYSEALSRTDALYFSVTVFSTVGFGDIVARSEPARLLTTGQMTVNLLLLSVAVRLIVNAVEQAKQQRDPGGDPP
ncbi:potassium channel family protein [Streptomyces virginiae]|uniref:potassium channel family protein n=1 Tax=Streptomyces virginiae TaxID=1961 RepID=UPI003668FF81